MAFKMTRKTCSLSAQGNKEIPKVGKTVIVIPVKKETIVNTVHQGVMPARPGSYKVYSKRGISVLSQAALNLYYERKEEEKI